MHLGSGFLPETAAKIQIILETTKKSAKNLLGTGKLLIAAA